MYKVFCERCGKLLNTVPDEQVDETKLLPCEVRDREIVESHYACPDCCAASLRAWRR